jgi:hypothetical protein
MEDFLPRPSRPLDPTTGPVQAFAAELRQLREQAGNPKYLQMARTTGRSRTALAEAAGGDHLPTWETVAAFITACKGDVPAWRSKWEQVRDQVKENGNDVEDLAPKMVQETESPVSAGGRPGEQPRPRRVLPYVATALATALVAVGATIFFTRNAPAQSPETQTTNTTSAKPFTAIIITVQNKVALGADRLIEDTTPVYLSAKTVPYCARDGCKISGTEMASGAMLVAVCHTPGTEMFNYNLDSSESKQNPHRASSTVWYRAALQDGRTGYISEVYIAPADRGGKGLPACG